jgi:hypothetical protein
VERATIVSVRYFLFGAASFVKRGFGRDGDEGVESRVELFDAREAIAGKFNGRDFAVVNFST